MARRFKVILTEEQRANLLALINQVQQQPVLAVFLCDTIGGNGKLRELRSAIAEATPAEAL